MRRITPVAALALGLLCGCGDEDDRIVLVPVSGTITKNGKPMAGAKVTFNPDATNKVSTPGVDETGPEGNFKLKFKTRTGVAPGKYKVIVEPAIEIGTAKVPDAFKDDPYMAKLSLGSTPNDDKKKAGEKSEFDADVDDKGGVFDFDVKSSGTPAKK